MEKKSFKQLLRESFKSNDTEEWLDIYFTRPIGLVFALMWIKIGVTPNFVTILSMFLGLGPAIASITPTCGGTWGAWC